MKHRSSDTVREAFRLKGFGLYEGKSNDSPRVCVIGGHYMVRAFKTTRPVAIPSVAYKADDGLHVIRSVQFGTEGNVGFFTDDRDLKTVNTPTKKSLLAALVLVDDLTLINRITQQLELRLRALGITRFEQIAAWSDDDVQTHGAKLGCTGLIKQLDWIGQAQVLQTGALTGYANNQIRLRRRRSA